MQWTSSIQLSMGGTPWYKAAACVTAPRPQVGSTHAPPLSAVARCCGKAPIIRRQAIRHDAPNNVLGRGHEPASSSHISAITIPTEDSRLQIAGQLTKSTVHPLIAVSEAHPREGGGWACHCRLPLALLSEHIFLSSLSACALLHRYHAVSHRMQVLLKMSSRWSLGFCRLSAAQGLCQHATSSQVDAKAGGAGLVNVRCRGRTCIYMYMFMHVSQSDVLCWSDPRDESLWERTHVLTHVT